MSEHIERVSRTTGGIKALGSVAQGAFENMLGPWSKRMLPAVARRDKALDAVQRIREYIDNSMSDFKFHVAWVLIVRSVCEALSYDSRLIPPR
eukprot:2870613-Karenia_brevis.AAC.1